MKGLACAGNALLDVSAFVSRADIDRLGFVPGSTNHVPEAAMELLLGSLADTQRLAGGGAANTARVFHSLGGDSRFAGALGLDAAGALYESDMSSAGVGCFFQKKNGSTGLFCVLIDETSTRTIIVSPGLASAIQAERIPAAFFHGAGIFHADGFLAASSGLLPALMRRATQAGLAVSFDVGGFRVAQANRDLFRQLIRDYCDWVFLNEDEYKALTGHAVDISLPELAAELDAMIIVKRAQNGAVCAFAGELLESPVRAIKPIDATGAGDAFAAGFLMAVSRKVSPARALRFGNRVAEHAIQVPGMRINTDLLATLPDWFL